MHKFISGSNAVEIGLSRGKLVPMVLLLLPATGLMAWVPLRAPLPTSVAQALIYLVYILLTLLLGGLFLGLGWKLLRTGQGLIVDAEGMVDFWLLEGKRLPWSSVEAIEIYDNGRLRLLKFYLKDPKGFAATLSPLRRALHRNKLGSFSLGSLHLDCRFDELAELVLERFESHRRDSRREFSGN